jgi:hypothetical protein
MKLLLEGGRETHKGDICGIYALLDAYFDFRRTDEFFPRLTFKKIGAVT